MSTGPAHPTPPAPLPEWLPPTPPGGDGEWTRRAACQNDPDPDRWVDLPALRVRGHLNPAYPQRVEQLRATCRGCPVRAACAWRGLLHDLHGVWGGLDEFDRDRLRATLHLPPPAPVTADPPDAEQQRMDQLRRAARHLARLNQSNQAIAAVLAVSTMTVVRLLDERDTAPPAPAAPPPAPASAVPARPTAPADRDLARETLARVLGDARRRAS